MIFWGTTEHFLGKNGELRWNILSGETKITKLPWQRSVRPQCQDGVEVLKCYELRCQDIKKRYTKPEHTKQHVKKDSIRLSKNSENPELYPDFKLLTFRCVDFSIDTINIS